MADWNKPALGDTYINFQDLLKARDIDALTLGLNTLTNIPVGAIRFDRTNNVFQEWNGTIWINKILAAAGGGTGQSSSAFGTMVTQNADNVNITGGNISGLASLQVNGNAGIGGLLVTGSALVPLTDATGKIVAIDSTRFANLSGGQLTGLNALAISGIIPPANLGSGTPDATKVLKGDGTWGTGGGGGSSKPFITFTPGQGEPTAANYATFETRNSHLVLAFDNTTIEDIMFAGVLPIGYAGGGLEVNIYYAAGLAASGDVRWGASFERIGFNIADLDVDNFAPFLFALSTTLPTVGAVSGSSISFANGAPIGNLVAGDAFRLKIRRDASHASDTMSGDAQLVRVTVREP